jgi:predicted membrane protein
VSIGILLLLDNLLLDLPKWVFTWHTILIALGLFVGAKHRFRGGGWFIMVLVGLYFTIEAAMPIDFNATQILFPSLLVILGLFLIFKPKSKYCEHQKQWKKRMERKNRRYASHPKFGPGTDASQNTDQSVSDPYYVDSRTDFLDSVNVFGGSQQTVYSKSFKGGDVVAVFGGADINLSQADFEGEVVLEIVAVFGGAKIVIPKDWVVKHEVTVIMGGVDDKRAILPLQEGPQKVLVVRGLAMLGGIEIKNF